MQSNSVKAISNKQALCLNDVSLKALTMMQVLQQQGTHFDRR